MKFTMIIKQVTERKGEPLSSGVNKAFVVAAVFDGDEEIETLGDIMDKIEIYECKFKYCNDLKVAVKLCGIMPGWPSYPCPYCEAHKDHLDEVGKLRTIWSLFEHHENYEEECGGLKSEKAKSNACKNHRSVQFRTLLAQDKHSVDIFFGDGRAKH